MNVIAFGEVLVDMLSSQVVDGPEARLSFYPVPGGAPANVAVALAKLGVDSGFAGGIANDEFGEYLKMALVEEGVGVDLLQPAPAGKTALAFVSLDSTGERSFSFYGKNAAHLEYDATAFPEERLDNTSIFHFGSNSLTEASIHAATVTLVELARSRGALVSFDINYRPGLWASPADAPGVIAELARHCHIIKASREEMLDLYGASARDEVERWIRAGVALVVITDGAEDLEYFHADGTAYMSVPSADVVDTTAAGDAFTGGLLSRIAADAPKDIHAWAVDPQGVASAVTFATRCGAHAVTKPGAFSSLPAMEDLA